MLSLVRRGCRGTVLTVMILLSGSANAQEKPKFLRIGTAAALSSGRSPIEQKAALKTLKQFIKDETGFDNEIVEEKTWQTLAEQMAKGNVQVGAFRGFEFAWAKQRYPALKPLALVVNGTATPIVYVVTRKDSKARQLADLQGQTLALPAHRQGALPRRFVDQEIQIANKDPKTFFSHIVTKDNLEDLLDDVVDGKVQAAAVEGVGLQAYKRRKPGRFNQIKEIAQSPPVLPGIIAVYDQQLDASTCNRFQKGLLSANQNDKGQSLLTMFHLTGFERVPANFAQVMARTLKTFPVPGNGK